MNSNPLVSITMITYNHDKFINSAIDSVLNQKVDFKYELLISDDASTDSTQKIIIAYKKLHPDKIFTLLRKENVGAALNSMELKKSARGKYIAILEGDDYWTDDFKLSKQIHFLENHPEIYSTGHLYKIIDKNNNVIGSQALKLDSSREFNKSDILKLTTSLAHPNSLVHRNFYLSDSKILDQYYKSNRFGSHSLLLFYLGTKSNIYMFNEYMSVWRKVIDLNSSSYNSYAINHRLEVGLNNATKYYYYNKIIPNEYDFKPLIRLNYAMYFLIVALSKNEVSEKIKLIKEASFVLNRVEYIYIPFIMIKIVFIRFTRD